MIQPEAPPEGYRLSSQQSRYWKLASGNGYAPAALAACVRIDGPLALDRFAAAVPAVIARHESFRTRLACLPGMVSPVQVIDRAGGEVPLSGELPEPLTPQAWTERLAGERRPLLLALRPVSVERHHLWIAVSRDVADPASLAIFVHDLVRAYRGDVLPADEVLQYADYAEWQHELLSQGDDAAARYWRRPGWTELLQSPIPLAVADSSVAPLRWESRPLATPDSSALARLAQQHAVPVSDVLLAGWCAWLLRLTGRSEVVVGWTSDGRNEELHDACGAYERVLPLRIALGGEASFADLVRQVRDARIEAEDHGDYFGWDLLAAGSASGARQPVCPFGFAYYPTSAAQMAGTCRFRLDCGMPMPIEPHGLHLAVLEGPDGCTLWFHSDAARFAPAAAECLIAQFQTLLAGALRETGAALASLPILDPSERAHVLESFQPAPLDPAAGLSLHGLLERAAAQAPEATALRYDTAAWSHAELNAICNRLARRLKALGVRPETPVGVATTHPVEMILGALAVLKAGGVYVPLDPAHPAERLAALVRDAGLVLLLGDAAPLARLGEVSCRLLCLAAEFPHLDRYAADNLDEALLPEQLAYLIYTSGSTGQPKGVAVTHANAVQSTRARLAYYPHAGGNFLLLSAFTFDSSIAGIFGTLARGGCLVLPREGVVQDLGQLERLMATSAVSELLCVPSLYAVLLDQLDPGVLRALETVIVAGEACPGRLVRGHHERLPGTALVNEYGPTEATVWSTAYRSRPGDGALPVPIGQAVGHVRVYVLDERLEPVPRGLPGELYVGGEGVTRGYWRRAASTAEAFVPDPFDAPGARMYRTGDRVRYELDGRLAFLGRRDHQVKIRGFRIEPGEIETVLNDHPAVRAAAVISRDDHSGEPRLVGYAALATGEDDLDAVKAYLAERLPDYMVPAIWVVVRDMPLTRHGKIDRQALPEPAAPEAGRYVAPRTDAERILAEIWCELLRVERVGIEDSFFALGGDSILSIQMVSRARQRGLVLTARQVFATPTIAALAPSNETAAPSPAQDRPAGAAVPLTPIQRWFFELRYPSPNRWTHAVLLQPRRAVDDGVLAAAAEAVVRHHAALRMQYRRVGTDWQQTVRTELPQGAFQRVAYTDHAESDERLLEAAAERWSEIDVTREPLLRVVRIDTAHASYVLIVLHHLVADGLSWRIVLEDLGTACRQLARGIPVQLPPTTTPFTRWAEQLQAHARSTSVLAELPRWQTSALAATAPLPLDDPSGDGTEATSAVLRTVLGAADTEALLRDAHAAYHTQIDDLLLAALTRCLTQWNGRDSVRVDLDRHGREPLFDTVDLTRTVGWFTSVVPLVLRREPGWGALLIAVKEQLRAAPHHGINYGVLRYLTDGDAATGDLRRQPMAPVIFNYLGRLDSLFDASGEFALVEGHVRVGADPQWQRPYELAINADVYEGRLRMEWAYSRARLRPETVKRLADAYLASLRELIAHCRSVERSRHTPSDFPLARLDQATVDRLSSTYPVIEDVYPATATQAGMLFHSRLRPDAGYYVQQVAVTFTGTLDRAAFAAAWDAVLRRHPALRTVFVDDADRGLLQLVLPDVPVPLSEADWRGLSGAQQHARWQSFTADDRDRGFDPAVAPLLRLALIRLADDRYRFLWSHHHALIDGWCPGLIFGELLHIYTTLRDGDSARPAACPPFRDYIAWLQRQDPEAADRYFAQALAGFDEPTPLPLAGSPDAAEPGHGDCRVALPVALTAALDRFARQHQLTLNTLVQGAWALLLSRCGGSADIVFGVTLSGRPADLPGVERMVGLFINTLPLRVRLPSRMPVVDWLKDVQARNAELRQYEYSPLSEVLRHAAVPRGRSLFDSIVVFENYPIERAVSDAGAALGVEAVEFTEQTHYPLALIAVPGDRLELQLRYDRSRFAADAVTRMAGQFERLLEAFLAHPTGALGRLGLLSPAEQRMAVETGLPRVTGRVEDSLIGRFERIASGSPEAVAVRCNGAALTYRELTDRAGRLSRRLRALGVRSEHRVGVCVERGPDLVVAMLGVLKAGAAYVPLPPEQPALRLAELVADAGLTWVVGDRAARAVLPPAASLLELEAALGVDDPGAELEPVPAIDPEQAAYVIYTSGSTGRPKGVVVTHRNVVRLFDVAAADFGFGPSDVWSLFHSYAFDFSVWEIWGALLHGGTIVVVPAAATRDVAACHRLLVDEAVTVLSQTPSSFYRLDAADAEAGRRLASLRYVVFGGEALDPLRLSAWFAHYGDEAPALINMYGITETTVHVTLQRLSADHARGSQGSVIGRALDDLGVLLVDAAGQLVPPGIPGELLVAGAGLARGYLGQPGLTAERFVPHPCGAPGERLYRSGDLARRLTDGTLQYLGRIDEQIKIRGYRIELGEITARLLDHTGLRDACVVAQPVRDGELRLIAYVVARGERPAEDMLRAYLRERLPDYMLPAAYVWLEQLPLTVNGKLDRRALPAVERGSGGGNVAPRTATEAVLAGIWSDVLQAEPVGVYDNFFDLGGHSLLATQIVSQIRITLQRDVPLAVVFEQPTLAGLAAAIDASGPAAAESAVAAIAPRSRAGRRMKRSDLGG